MVQLAKVTGLKEVIAKLRLVDKRLSVSTRRGLLKSGAFVLRKSKEIVPIEFGPLKASGDMKPIGEGWKTDVVVFYTASYAVYVHERTELKHKPGKSAKYLEKPVRQYKLAILKIIAKEAKKGISSSGGGRRWANQHRSGFIGG